MEIHGFKAASHIVREVRFQFNSVSFYFNKLKKIKSKPNQTRKMVSLRKASNQNKHWL